MAAHAAQGEYEPMRIAKLIAVALAALLAATVAITAGATNDVSAANNGEAALYEVTITNTTSGQYFTPPNWAAHSTRADVFQRGQVASPGVEAVAERGEVPVLAAELAANIDDRGFGVSGVALPADPDAPPPMSPGESRTFQVVSSEARFSLVTMIICTNDGFGGIDSNRLPWIDGQTKTYNLRDFDAGSERNTEIRDDFVPAPFCSTPAGAPGGTVAAQPDLDSSNNVIRWHPTINGVGDVPASFDWERGSVGEVTITRVEQATNYSISIENLTPGQYFTPPNIAAHGSDADVFELGEVASPGVVAVAEGGQVPVLAAELVAALDDAGLGDSAVIGGGPFGPGDSVSGELNTTSPRLSLVSMVICTNDSFGGLDSRLLPTAVGNTREYLVYAFDAGAEINTENRADLVPAPFCNGPGGTPDSQDDLAENGVISRNASLRGVGDIPLSFDWTGAVLRLTVTNNG